MLAAGGGHILIIVFPGIGKFMLARRFPTILLPPPPESLETTRIYSVMGRLPAGEALLACLPFRSLDHTLSEVLASWFSP